MKKWSSYTVANNAEILHHASHPMGGHRMYRRIQMTSEEHELIPFKP